MKLLVAIDFSEATDKILEHVKNLVCKTGSAIWLLHVAMPDPDFVGYDVGPETEREFIAKKFRDQHTKLEEIADHIRKEGIEITPLLIQGPTVETILEQAAKLKVDAIIVGSHGRGAMYKLLVGSVSEGLLHKTKIPLVVIPAKMN
jgi:nucleotide-binding universal stress UspA family protein